MATVYSASLRDEFDAYKADIVSLRKEGEITEKTDKVLTGLCDLVTILTAAFLEKTTKKVTTQLPFFDKSGTKEFYCFHFSDKGVRASL